MPTKCRGNILVVGAIVGDDPIAMVDQANQGKKAIECSWRVQLTLVDQCRETPVELVNGQQLNSDEQRREELIDRTVHRLHRELTQALQELQMS